jgi:hypothetical protein
MGANCVCDAPKAAEDDNLWALTGAATTDAEVIAVAAAMMSKMRIDQQTSDQYREY